MDFGTALKMMRSGSRLTRSDWDDAKRLVWLKDDVFKRSEKTLAPTQTSRVDLTYNPTVQDIMAWDWELEDKRNSS